MCTGQREREKEGNANEEENLDSSVGMPSQVDKKAAAVLPMPTLGSEQETVIPRPNLRPKNPLTESSRLTSRQRASEIMTHLASAAKEEAGYKIDSNTWAQLLSNNEGEGAGLLEDEYDDEDESNVVDDDFGIDAGGMMSRSGQGEGQGQSGWFVSGGLEAWGNTMP